MVFGKAGVLKFNIYVIIIVLSHMLLSCGRKKNMPIARAYDVYLYADDLKDVINPGITGMDSLNLVNSYIENWQRQQALLHNAQKERQLNSERFKAQIEEYKNALIIHEFEDALIKEKLDTLVTEKEIVAYYERNQNVFILKRPIFKVSYIQIPKDAPEIDRVKRWFLSNNLPDQNLLLQYCQTYSSNFSLGETPWYYLETLAKEIPIEQIDENNYKNYGQIFEINEKDQLYLIILRDSKLQNNISPLDMERDNIHNLLINQRKVELIHQEENRIVEEARRKNNIETYK